MIKRIFLVLFVLCLSLAVVTAESPNPEDLEKAVTVITDCLWAEIITQYSISKVNLPSCTMSTDSVTSLPVRVSFFMTDPAVLMSAIGQKIGNTQNFFSYLSSILSKNEEDPLLSSVYLAMSSRDYSVSDYLLNGSISITYPENLSLDAILDNWLDMKSIITEIDLSLSLSLYGDKISVPVVLEGIFELSTNENKDIVVKSVSEYYVNDCRYCDAMYIF